MQGRGPKVQGGGPVVQAGGLTNLKGDRGGCLLARTDKLADRVSNCGAE